MKDGFANTTDSELKEIWENNNDSKYSEDFIKEVNQELINRGLF